MDNINIVVILLITALFPFPILWLVFALKNARASLTQTSSSQGYCTKLALSSDETYVFAQIYWWKISKIFGILLIFLTFLSLLIIINTGINFILIAWGIIFTLEIALYLLAILLTQRAIKKNFSIR